MLFRKPIAQWIYQTLTPTEKTLPSLSELEAALSPPTEEARGDAMLPCFRFAKPLAQSPLAIAKNWGEKLGAAPLHPFVKGLSVTGGYLNFDLKAEAYAPFVLETLFKNPAGFGTESTFETWRDVPVLVEFSSPNMAKPIGIHHIRSTVIGNSLARIFAFAGAAVKRLNYIGDYGTNFGQLCYAFTHWGSREKLKSEGINHLLEIYVRFNTEAEKDPKLKEEAKNWFVKLENEKPDALELWNLFREVSFQEFDFIYKRMDITFDEMYGEAHYAKLVDKTLEEISKVWKIEESEGAQVIFIEGFPTPLLIRKSDGSTLYGTRDLAVALDRVQRHKAKLILYVVGSPQKLHFQQFFTVVKKVPFMKDATLQHVTFGLLRFPDGTMSTRKGKVLFLNDVLDQAVEKAGKIIDEKNPTCPDRDAVAEAVGVGALVFNDLKSRRDRDIEFRWEEALNFDGDSGPYVQYTHARCCSLLEKNGAPKMTPLSAMDWPEEAARVVSRIGNFSEAIARAIADREPYPVAQYLLNVCGDFNALYAKVKVRDLTGQAREALLQTTEATRIVLSRGLGLLGLRAPTKI